MAALLSVLGGCGMSSLTSGIGGGWFGGAEQAPRPRSAPSARTSCWPPPRPTAGTAGSIGGDVAHGCPRFQVWSRDGYVTIYEPGRVGDGLAVMHRGEITKTARECQIEPGRVTVKYGFSGRVLLGPKGRTGRVTLPLNVFVTDAKREKMATDKVKVDVDVALDKPIGYFSIVRTVTFNVPEGSRPGEFEVFVGFASSAGIARLRRRDDGDVERAVGADRAGRMLAREVARQPLDQARAPCRRSRAAP